MKFARGVLYFEAIFINLGVGLLCFFLPGAFVSNFTTQNLTPVSLELTRWYGVLLFVLAYGMLRALRSGSETAVNIMVEALLVGDLAHLAASAFFFANGGAFNLPSIFMLVMSCFLAGVRIFWLTQVRRVR